MHVTFRLPVSAAKVTSGYLSLSHEIGELLSSNVSRLQPGMSHLRGGFASPEWASLRRRGVAKAYRRDPAVVPKLGHTAPARVLLDGRSAWAVIVRNEVLGLFCASGYFFIGEPVGHLRDLEELILAFRRLFRLPERRLGVINENLVLKSIVVFVRVEHAHALARLRTSTAETRFLLKLDERARNRFDWALRHASER